MSAPDIPLDNINVDLDLDLDLSGSLDVGLAALSNALTTGVKAGVDVGLNEIRLRELAPVRISAELTELPPVRVSAEITELPPLQVQAAVTALPVIRTDSKVDLGLDIRIRELPPLKVELSMKPLRAHLPLNYSFCIQLFGLRLFTFSVQGEGMLIQEDYVAHATERC